jgi:hypothetical protein
MIIIKYFDFFIVSELNEGVRNLTDFDVGVWHTSKLLDKLN